MTNNVERLIKQNMLQTPAVVLSCLGSPEADLNVVRSLGECGVPVILLSEYSNAPASASKYCTRTIVAQEFTKEPGQLFRALKALHGELGIKPVVFPTADPDLRALIELAGHIHEVAISTVIEPQMAAVLTDKYAFHELADKCLLPVPKTITLRGINSKKSLSWITNSLNFPLILKPAHPTAWHDPSLPDELAYSKAIPIENADTLQAILQQLDNCLENTLIQEFVPGDDAEHYDVHVYMGHDGKAKASYCGRKIRIYPPHAGSGCYVKSVREQSLEEDAINMLESISYRGLANINYKRHSRTGAFILLEINPRVSQWSILAMRSGVNLPLHAYYESLSIGEPERVERRYGINYINEINDLKAFRTYWREGLWNIFKYVTTWLKRPMVMQLLQMRDTGPFWLVIRQAFARRFRLKRG